LYAYGAPVKEKPGEWVSLSGLNPTSGGEEPPSLLSVVEEQATGVGCAHVEASADAVIHQLLVLINPGLALVRLAPPELESVVSIGLDAPVGGGVVPVLQLDTLHIVVVPLDNVDCVEVASGYGRVLLGAKQHRPNASLLDRVKDRHSLEAINNAVMPNHLVELSDC
jgi:hypothetical protein